MRAWRNDPADQMASAQHGFGLPAGSLFGRVVSAPPPLLTVVRSEPEKAPRRRGADVAHGPSAALIVELARCFVTAHIGRQLDAETLARATAVSESTLRRTVLAETGMQLSGFILNLRLDQAHAWLSSNREARTQSQIARALGYNSSAAFSRAYRRRFGEAMSETRQRAVNSFYQSLSKEGDDEHQLL